MNWRLQLHQLSCSVLGPQPLKLRPLRLVLSLARRAQSRGSGQFSACGLGALMGRRSLLALDRSERETRRRWV